MPTTLPDVKYLQRRRQSELNKIKLLGQPATKTQIQHAISVVHHRLTHGCVQPEDWKWRLPKMAAPAKPDYSSTLNPIRHLPRLLAQPPKRDALPHTKILPRIQDCAEKKKALQGLGHFLRQMATLAPVTAITEFGEQFDDLLATTAYTSLVAPLADRLSSSWRLCRSAEDLEQSIMRAQGCLQILDYRPKPRVPAVRRGGGYLIRRHPLSATIRNRKVTECRALCAISGFLFGKPRTHPRKRLHSRRSLLQIRRAGVRGHGRKVKVTGVPAIIHIRETYLDKRHATGAKRKLVSFSSQSKHRTYGSRDSTDSYGTESRRERAEPEDFDKWMKNRDAWREAWRKRQRVDFRAFRKPTPSGRHESNSRGHSTRENALDGKYDIALEDLDQPTYAVVDEENGIHTDGDEVVISEYMDERNAMLLRKDMDTESQVLPDITFAFENTNRKDITSWIDLDKSDRNNSTDGPDLIDGLDLTNRLHATDLIDGQNWSEQNIGIREAYIERIHSETSSQQPSTVEDVLLSKFHTRKVQSDNENINSNIRSDKRSDMNIRSDKRSDINIRSDKRSELNIRSDKTSDMNIRTGEPSNGNIRSIKASDNVDIVVTTNQSAVAVKPRTSQSTTSAQKSPLAPSLQLLTEPDTPLMTRRHSAVPGVIDQPQSLLPSDPEEIETLSWLSKYCIIRQDRLQFYKSVFQNVISQQTHPDEPSTTTGSEVTFREVVEDKEEEGDERDGAGYGDYLDAVSSMGTLARKRKLYEDKLVREWLEKSRANDPGYNMVGLTEYQQAVVTIDCYITEQENRLKSLQTDLREAEGYLPAPTIMEARAAARKKKQRAVPLTRAEYTVERLRVKVHEANKRIEQLRAERIIVDRHNTHDVNNVRTMSDDRMSLWRTRSFMYRDLHPIADKVMNMEELEGALQTVNSNLINHSEMHYLYRILDLHPKRRVGIKVFSVIAALSEKVAKLDGFTRKLMNTFDFESLEEKLRISKDLFNLMKGNEYDTPMGMASACSVLTELYAGGMSEPNAIKALRKFEKDGSVDFLDYLIYVPLFVEVHNNIVENPFNVREL